MHMYRFVIYSMMYRGSPHYLVPEKVLGVAKVCNQGELEIFC